MTSKLGPVPQSAPISDNRGILAPVWARWFQDLMTRVGGFSAKTNIELDTSGIIPINRGGTGQTTQAAAFNALHPMTTTGDMIYSSSGITAARLAIGSSGDLLSVSGGVPAYISPNGAVRSLGTITVFTASGTFTTPANSTTSTVYEYQMVGGGGGGGGGAGGTNGGGGGGQGAIARGTFTGISPSTGIAVTINSGGGGGASGSDGSAGGSVSLGLATAITCGGGAGGKGTTGGSGYSQGGAGGAVTSGSPNILSMVGQNGSNGFGVSGVFSLGGSGGGAGPSTAASGAGDNATIYGAGGGGGGVGNAGGNGKTGYVIITQLTP